MNKVMTSTMATLNFQVCDVTGTNSIEARDVQGSLPASTVAESLAATLNLPENIPYGLRNDQSSEFLDDRKPIGDQVEPDANLTLTPKRIWAECLN